MRQCKSDDLGHLIDGKDYPWSNQATEWAGWQIAKIVGLPLERKPSGKGAPVGHYPVSQLIKHWTDQSWLVVEEVPDGRRGSKRKVIRVGTWVEPEDEELGTDRD